MDNSPLQIKPLLKKNFNGYSNSIKGDVSIEDIDEDEIISRSTILANLYVKNKILLRKRRRSVLVAVGIFLILIVTPTYQFFDGNQNHCQYLSTCFSSLVSRVGGYNEISSQYIVFTNSCKLLNLDAFDPSVKKFLKKGKKWICPHALVFLDQVENKLKLNKNLIKKNKKYKESKVNCCYKTILRRVQSNTKYDRNADWEVKISDKCVPIDANNGTAIYTSYFQVECDISSHSKSKFSRKEVQFLSNVVPPTNFTNLTKWKTEKWRNHYEKLANISKSNKSLEYDHISREFSVTSVPPPPNVLIIGIDSISRLHMHRQLPITKKWLEKSGWIEYLGYTKIGENTFPNIMGILTGLSSYKYSSCWNDRKEKLDNCPFIWNNFSSEGYVTALVEDAPGIAIFNYEKTGFVKDPVDYYLRPLMVSSHLHEKRGKSTGQMSCLSGMNPTQFLMDYIKRFGNALNHEKMPYFLLSWFTNIAHDDFNGLSTEDEAFKNFLETMMNLNNNTIIFFISDHGYRFGKFRESFLGFYEESLPFFFVYLPKVYHQISTEFSKNFEQNEWFTGLEQNRVKLTSPLDFHETLKDILELAKNIQNFENTSDAIDISTKYENDTFPPNYSFFYKDVPSNRTCESSRIPQSYCMCGVSPSTDRKSKIIQELAVFLINHLNTKILDTSKAVELCHKLKLKKVLYGRELKIGEIWNGFGKLEKYQDHLVGLDGGPGEAHFEARIRTYNNGTKTLLEDISRINAYKGLSDCIENPILKKYCQCKNLVEKT